MEKIKQFLLFVTSPLVKDTLFSMQKSLYKKEILALASQHNKES